MRKPKFKKGIVVKTNKERVEFTLPNPLTLEWMKKYAYHYAGVPRDEVEDVIPILKK